MDSIDKAGSLSYAMLLESPTDAIFERVEYVAGLVGAQGR